MTVLGLINFIVYIDTKIKEFCIAQKYAGIPLSHFKLFSWFNFNKQTQKFFKNFLRFILSQTKTLTSNCFVPTLI